VSDSALTSRVNAARCAIGDSGNEQRLIKTHLRKGIRFVGTVREEQKPEAAGAAIPVASKQSDLTSSQSSPESRPNGSTSLSQQS
jgi:DNA-binding winged helix-turn-helix (wHTH) protein